VKRVPFLLCLSVLATLLAGAASAQTFSYVPIPTVSPGVTSIKVEMLRSDLSLSDVHATYVPEGTSGLTASAATLKAYVGPSTSRQNPLLALSPIAPGGGMVILDPVAGLDAVEVSMEIEQGPVRTAWKLPLLSANDFFRAGSTVYVQNLAKFPDVASSLQLFNLDSLAATCSATVLRPRGSTLDVRTGITVPAVGVVRVPDILRNVRSATASGLNVAVTCDKAFYAMGAVPTADRWNTRVQYPVAKLPANVVAQVLDSRPGGFFRVTQGSSDLKIPLALDPNAAYHTLAINMDVSVADPPSFVVFRNVIGMFRFGGRRFGKTLFFGSFENFDKQKYVIDLGTPFIETTLKRNFPLLNGNTYHFAITLDNDQQSLHYVITNRAGAVVTDVLGGLYNNFNVFQGNAPIIELGLGGVADNAYFPPFGWRFANLSIVATR
jgi:hypothetical protein